MHAEGYLHFFDSVEELTEYAGGPPLLNKIAFLVKTRRDGKVKVRVITDLLRSRGNEFLKAPERIVLPRLVDALEMAIYVLEGLESDLIAGLASKDEECEWGTTDIKDAFPNMPVAPPERRAQCYKIWESFATSDSLVFGAGPSPLIWGRMGAWAGRAAQGLFDFHELLLQIFVDDPLWFVRGTKERRRRLVVILLLFWQAFGFPFSGPKGAVGPEVPWIGAELVVDNGGPHGRGVRVVVPADRLDQMREEADRFLAGNVISRKALRSFAGGASFIAGLVPFLRPFLGGLWAAVKDVDPAAQPDPAGRMHAGDPLKVWTPQVRWSLEWLRAFFTGTGGVPLVRVLRLRDLQFGSRFTAAVDASPWGIGGLLMEGDVVVACFADRVQADDIRRLGVVVGDHRSQAVLEGLVVLVALRLFAGLAGWTAGCHAHLGVRSDSKAALGAALNLASPGSILNAIGAEIAYDQAMGDYAVDLFEHTEGVANVSPDALSRRFAPGEAKPLPAVLRGAPELPVPVRGPAWWRTWSAPTGAAAFSTPAAGPADPGPWPAWANTGSFSTVVDRR